LLDSMLILDPAKRISADDALKNSWLSAVNSCIRLEYVIYCIITNCCSLCVAVIVTVLNCMQSVALVIFFATYLIVVA